MFLAVEAGGTETIIIQLTGFLILAGLLYKPLKGFILAINKLIDATEAVHNQLIPATGEGLKQIIDKVVEYQNASLDRQKEQTKEVTELVRMLAAQNELYDARITEIWKTLASHGVDRRAPKEG